MKFNETVAKHACVRGEEILNLSGFRRFSMSLKSVAKDIDTGKQVSIRAK